MVTLGRMTAIAAALAATCTAVSGCQRAGGTTTSAGCLRTGVPVAVAVGARSNSPAPSIAGQAQAVLNGAVQAGKKVSIVRIDGKPTVVFSSAPVQGANSQLTKQNKDTFVRSLNQVLAGTADPATDLRAQVAQADVLDALAEAASTVPPGGDVIVIDSGLQTTEPLDFRTGLLADSPQSIVRYLKRANELPDLTGRHVYFMGLGWTAPPQPALSIADRKLVTAIWKRIARASHAKCVAAEETANTRTATPGRPPVAIVIPPAPPKPPSPCTSVNLGDANHVGFDFNSTTFRQPALAHATLRQLADVILKNGESVTLIGSTSSEGSDQYNQALSLRRANAVRAVLEQLGIPAGHIKTVGDGSHLPGRINDRGPDGKLLVGPAILDRKVVAKLSGPKCPTT